MTTNEHRLTQEEHRQRHVLLHQMYDEGIADYFRHNRGRLPDQPKVPSNTTLSELMVWSHRQTISPDEVDS